MFTRGGYWERTLTNEFILKRVKNPAPRPATPTADRPGVGIPDGSRSQTWEYIDRKTRQRIAKVHQYVRPDGMIGAWGRKWLPVTEALSIRAELLEKGGPQMWAAFMEELRADHLGAPKPARSVRRELLEAYRAVVEKQAAEVG